MVDDHRRDYHSDMTTFALSARAPSIHTQCGVATHVGKVRQLNEDSYLAMAGAYVVADGMGGHNAGDVASGLAIEAVRSEYLKGPLDISSVQRLVDAANDLVWSHAQSTGNEGMGCTLVGAFLVTNGDSYSVVVANVGDSRCYVAVDEGVHQLTRDHSHVQELVDAGMITPREADRHPDRNIVTRAIGGDDHVAGDFYIVPPARHVRLLLCSDGVSGELDRETLAGGLLGGNDPCEVAERLIARVLDGRARDNATALVVDLTWEAPATSADDVADLEDATGPRPRPDVHANPTTLIDDVPEVEVDTTVNDDAAEVELISDVPTWPPTEPTTGATE